jgi:hypothetical protein
MQTFERLHHRRIAHVLNTLNGSLLRENMCLFAGGTAIALRYGEYRESVDMDFLVSDIACYRNLRQMLTSRGIAAMVRDDAEPLIQQREIRADQYGIRTVLSVADQPIKFEIVLEGRMVLSKPGVGDQVCGIATLTPLDMATSKLLANSDRWADDGVFSRDVIDLAMMNPSLELLRQAVAKAESAYGHAIRQDLGKAIQRLQGRRGWLERCMEALAMNLPKALVWKALRSLRKVL